MHRRHVLLGAFALLVAPAGSVSAGGGQPFDPQTFRAAQEAGRSIVVQVHASW